MVTKEETSAATQPSSTELALERTHLAHERTLMAWVRTAVSLISFGFTIYKTFQYLQDQSKGEQVKRLLGVREYALLMIGIGLISLLLATLQQWRYRRKLRQKGVEVPYSLATAMAALMAFLGIIALLAVIFRQ
jgi:putative membrane protein